MKKYKIILQKSKGGQLQEVYRDLTDAQLEENKQKVKSYYFSRFIPHQPPKICKCGQNATHAQHEMHMGKVKTENWKCKECYGNKK